MREKDIQLIGGHSPLIILTSESEIKSGNLLIARHEQTRTDTHVVRIYYDRSIRKYRAVIPKSQSRKMHGNYTYHLQIISPDNTEFRPKFGRINFVEGVQQ